MNFEDFDNVGGLIGFSRGDLYITDSTVTGDVVGHGFGGDNASSGITGGRNVGGLIGSLGFSDEYGSDDYDSDRDFIVSIDKSKSTVSVSGEESVGGLIGSINSPDGYYNDNEIKSNITIERSYATGDVSADSNAGGFIGKVDLRDEHFSLDVLNNYSSGNVESFSSAGGFIGSIDFENHNWLIKNNYSAGNVTGESNIGGFVGIIEDNSDTVDSFYLGDAESSGIVESFYLVEDLPNGIDNNNSDLDNGFGEGLSSEDLRDADFLSSRGWDVETSSSVPDGSNPQLSENCEKCDEYPGGDRATWLLAGKEVTEPVDPVDPDPVDPVDPDPVDPVDPEPIVPEEPENDLKIKPEDIISVLKKSILFEHYNPNLNYYEGFKIFNVSATDGNVEGDLLDLGSIKSYGEKVDIIPARLSGGKVWLLDGGVKLPNNIEQEVYFIGKKES